MRTNFFPFIDCEYPTNDKFMSELKRILQNGPWSNSGTYHELFEKKLEKLLGTHVALVDHGESALLLMLIALDIKDKFVIVPSYTFVGTIAAIVWSGNYPLFCDIKSVTYPLINPDKVEEMALCATLKNINVTGLMTLGPRSKNEKKTRKAFSLLRKVKDRINFEIGENQLVDLSMGMSADYEIGIEEGSTMVRIGTALFGPRTPLK